MIFINQLQIVIMILFKFSIKTKRTTLDRKPLASEDAFDCVCQKWHLMLQYFKPLMFPVKRS